MPGFHDHDKKKQKSIAAADSHHHKQESTASFMPPPFNITTNPVSQNKVKEEEMGKTLQKKEYVPYQFPVQKKGVKQFSQLEPFQLKKSGINQKSQGQLPEEVQAKMENTMGHDFSEVNIHKDSRQATDAGALAYAQGNDIHFAPGQFKPDTTSGQELIGHELAHVVQQREGRVKPTKMLGKGMPVNDDPSLEKEADDLGRKAARGERISNNAEGVQPIQQKPAIQFSKSRDDFPYMAIAAIPGQCTEYIVLMTENECMQIPEGTSIEVTGASGEHLCVRYVDSEGCEYIGTIEKGHVDDPTTRALDEMEGEEAMWAPSSRGGSTQFAVWASASSEAAVPALSPTTTINCWEMVLLAAHRVGSMTWQNIHDLYTSTASDWTAELISSMTSGGLSTYDRGTKSPSPSRGDIVFFNGSSHVVLATGNGDEVLSFWVLPGMGADPNDFDTSVPSQVQRTSIQELYDVMDANRSSLSLGPTDPITITFGAPEW